MSIEKPVLETTSETLPLEHCTDPNVPAEQIHALQEQNVTVTKGQIRTSNAKVRYTLLAPEHSVDGTPVIIGNGYWATDDAYKPFAAQLALEGHTVALVKPPRTQDILPSLHPKHLKDVLLLQAQALWAVMKVMGEDQYDLYGHSMGGPVTSRVAEEKAERVRSLILAGPAGMDGGNGFITMLGNTGVLARRDVYGHRHDLRRNGTPNLLFGTLYHGFRRIDRTAREGITVAREDIRPRLQRIQESGIAIGALLFDQDAYFKSERILAASGYYLEAVHRTPDASHVYPQDHPVEHASDVAAMSDRLKTPAAVSSIA